jgi:hypothetical protein
MKSVRKSMYMGSRGGYLGMYIQYEVYPDRPPSPFLHSLATYFYVIAVSLC